MNNYTVRDFRPDTLELDIDVVLHRGPSGQLEGRIAQWAGEVQPGDRAAILDEGLLFNRPVDTRSVLLAGDESALPAIEGILRSLPAEIGGRTVLEVPTPEDVRTLDHGPGMEVQWMARSEVDPGVLPGAAALAALTAWPVPAADTYAFLVGESGLATGARRHLVRVWRRIGSPSAASGDRRASGSRSAPPERRGGRTPGQDRHRQACRGEWG